MKKNQQHSSDNLKISHIKINSFYIKRKGFILSEDIQSQRYFMCFNGQYESFFTLSLSV